MKQLLESWVRAN